MSAENALYTILVEKIRQDALVLPTLPEIALKVRRAVDDPDLNLAQISEIIGLDPALSVGMIKVANSAMLSRSVKVDTLSQAVTRIGLRQIKSIATAMAVEQVFVSENDIVAMYMNRSWQKTIDVAAVAIALMTLYLHENKHASLTLDTLTLAALVHNIGVLPILTEAEHHSDTFANPTFLQQAIVKLSAKIGGEVIKAWGFSDEFSHIIERWSDLTMLHAEPQYVDFIRAGAVYHGIFKNPATQEVLIKSYVAKGILPNAHFMDSDKFRELYENIRKMFA